MVINGDNLRCESRVRLKSTKAADKVHDKVSAETGVAGTEKNLDFG